MKDEKLICPFCRGEVRIVITDDEGNFHSEEYESDPYSGLWFALAHNEHDVGAGTFCPIATDTESFLGNLAYETRKEATEVWNQHKN